ncbi:hypothetical protein GYB22_12860 [bacterium]|nr:hypothetical protein [bacterium]
MGLEHILNNAYDSHYSMFSRSNCCHKRYLHGTKKDKERKRQWEEFKKKYPGSED